MPQGAAALPPPRGLFNATPGRGTFLVGCPAHRVPILVLWEAACEAAASIDPDRECGLLFYATRAFSREVTRFRREDEGSWGGGNVLVAEHVLLQEQLNEGEGT
jgi:hypothetical protein